MRILIFIFCLFSFNASAQLTLARVVKILAEIEPDAESEFISEFGMDWESLINNEAQFVIDAANIVYEGGGGEADGHFFTSKSSTANTTHDGNDFNFSLLNVRIMNFRTKSLSGFYFDHVGNVAFSSTNFMNFQSGSGAYFMRPQPAFGFSGDFKIICIDEDTEGLISATFDEIQQQSGLGQTWLQVSPIADINANANDVVISYNGIIDGVNDLTLGSSGNSVPLQAGRYNVVIHLNLKADTGVQRPNFFLKIKGPTIERVVSGGFYARGTSNHDSTGGSYTFPFVLKEAESIEIITNREANTGIVALESGWVIIEKLK